MLTSCSYVLYCYRIWDSIYVGFVVNDVLYMFIFFFEDWGMLHVNSSLYANTN